MAIDPCRSRCQRALPKPKSSKLGSRRSIYSHPWNAAAKQACWAVQALVKRC
jgi:hypothetical protein